MSLPSTSARGTLAAAALGFVVVLLDVSVVNVALDALRQEFATDVAGLQWVINAYAGSPRCCSPAARSGPAGRAAHLPGGLPGVHRGLGRVRPERQPGDADRRPPVRAGGGIAGAELAGHVAAGLSRSRAAQPRGGLGRIGACRRPPAGAGRNAGDAYGLAQHFLINLPIGLIGIHLTLRHVAAHGGAVGAAWTGRAGRGHPGIGRAYHGP